MCECNKVYDSVARKCGETATEYDRQKKEWGWYGPEVVFGLIYDYLAPGQSILDIGIGTGLGSIMFHQAGLHVHGMDLSPEMLKVCGEKGFTDDLKIHDLTVEPYPYPAASFDHAVSIGVLNHIEDLSPVFRETSRILKNNGVFAFIVDDRKDDASSFEVDHAGSRVILHRHGEELVKDYLNKTGYELLKQVEFRMSAHKMENRPFHLMAYAARKRNK